MSTINKNTFKISVHQFVDLVTKGGHLMAGAISSKRMQEGIVAHQYRQDASVAESEIPLQYSLEGVRVILQISGRADIIDQSGDYVVIEEIKSTYSKLETITQAQGKHLTQCKCYGAMYLLQHALDEIGIRITYVKLPEKQTVFIDSHFHRDEILDWFDDQCNIILEGLEKKQEHIITRNESLMNLEFPYKSYRAGQREMASKIFTACKNKEKVFLQAPTGIGKTMASLFPALKSMPYDQGEKIFYLTARGTIKAIASDALNSLREKGFYGRSITLNAKERMCKNSIFVCHPATCTRARGYYDRVDAALSKVEGNKHYDQRDVDALADEFHICPFELSLDMSLDCDVIICDYNHAYDPRAKLKRFFLERGDYIVLIDEAHNLVSRARDMFSDQVSKEDIMILKRKLPKTPKETELELITSVKALNNYFIQRRKHMKSNNIHHEVLSASPEMLDKLLSDFLDAAEPLLDFTKKDTYSSELLDLYFMCRSYVITSSKLTDHYTVYAAINGNDISYKLFCIDPSTRLQECHDKVRASIFFSASLTPFDYFTRLLCDDDIYDTSSLPTPFPEDNMQVMVSTFISTMYKSRSNSVMRLAETIYAFVSSKRGNYMVFFPSYTYMEMVHNVFIALYEDVFAPMQVRGMSESQRNAFISLFDNEDRHMAAFAVMGGIFAEGIDLIGNKLIGAVIVGTALPQINLEGNFIKEYHETVDENGFDYAYVYPGFNRVLQAVGRIIRTKNDKGSALLIDPRFMRDAYINLMPYWWKPIEAVSSPEDIKDIMSEFWN